MRVEEAVRELLDLPELSDSGARFRLECGEVADAASYLIEDVAEAGVDITNEQRKALLEGLMEYARGDNDIYEAYARLLA
ncbi:hypothetical protein [Corynebacterium urealyticum]|uniref:Uncharacterized protein n=1 Tax=Corynebacterium urealyticum (strain ATCC 43042 / DSM 7109) TaxID=504474 RepID=B1VIX5_CORU7|nr:hypothetical protein [Corynebacterium urealyticum]AGE37466.1 hypothetical protein CU7111_1883 [Corynebacterium urealyticum DSM 7111]QQC42542.1 hypothetical protein I6H51_02840 [Corynebacterium urealyticum]CAQ05921.1 hypothetical protein cu1962 [Corynebacterium urealyticum DSM 7109]SNV92103.1 Uncharacterised protein [Corynebacterium urealyticum]